MFDCDVAIIGLGPVGSTAAILLAEAGLQVVAIERDHEVYALPRAVNLDGEIIRAFQKVGRGQEVQDLMQMVRSGERAGFANANREWLFGQDARAFGRNGWQPMNMFDQPEFEGYLRRQATTHENVQSLIGFQAGKITAKDGHAVIETESCDTGERSSITSRYVIACDGAASATRKALNIGWVDLGYDHDWLVVDVTLREGHTLDNTVLQVCDPARIHTYVPTKDPYRRWEFKMNPGETAEHMLQPETIHQLIDPWTPRGTYTIRRAAVYQFHAANADRWREGPVFIAGDAAHQTPPFLGQGMNAGMRDVINLAWKLPLVIRGVVPDTILNSYFIERSAHAHDLVDWAVSIGQLMEHVAEQQRCAAEGLPAPATPDKLQSSGYGQGREQPPIRDGIVMQSQVSDDGATGYLFSQPLVRRGHETQNDSAIRLDDLLGPGFALVTRDDLIATKMSAQSRDILQTIDARTVSLQGLELVRGRFDRLFEAHDAAIVRPDAYVFGHTSEQVSLDELITALGDQLCLNTGP